MEFSSRTTENILQLNNISIEELRSICKYFLQALITGTSNTNVDERFQNELSSLSTFQLEASKFRSTPEAARKKLIQLGLNEDVSGIVSEVYGKYSGKIIEHMETTGISVPAIVGITVRGVSTDQDIVRTDGDIVRSQSADSHIFYITLKTSDRGVLRNIDMTATPDQLQDLLYKVKDAVKQTDRVMTSMNRNHG